MSRVEKSDETILNLKVIPFHGAELTDVLRAQLITANQAEFAWSAAMSEADFANEHAEYYVMVRGLDELVAYVSLHHILDEATINTVYVAPEWRQYGLGTRLLAFVLEQLEARAILNLFLEVRADNTAARALYSGAGFDELVVRHGYYHAPTDDAIIMQKQLVRKAGQSEVMASPATAMNVESPATTDMPASDISVSTVKNSTVSSETNTTKNQERGADDESDSSN